MPATSGNVVSLTEFATRHPKTILRMEYIHTSRTRNRVSSTSHMRIKEDLFCTPLILFVRDLRHIHILSAENTADPEMYGIINKCQVDFGRFSFHLKTRSSLFCSPRSRLFRNWHLRKKPEVLNLILTFRKVHCLPRYIRTISQQILPRIHRP
jgi:hypothetical protein